MKPPWWKRLWRWIFGRSKKKRSKPGMPAPHTLVMRIAAVTEAQEREMLRLAEEAVQRGHPEQAIIAYRKAAERFEKEGKAHKQLAVLNQLVRLKPDDPGAHAAMMDAYESLGRRTDAILSGTRAAALYQHHGHTRAAQEQQARVQALQSGSFVPAGRPSQGLHAVRAQPSSGGVASPSAAASGWSPPPSFSEAPAAPVAPKRLDSGPVELDLGSSIELAALDDDEEEVAVASPSMIVPIPPSPSESGASSSLPAVDPLIVPLPAVQPSESKTGAGQLVVPPRSMRDAPQSAPDWTDDAPMTDKTFAPGAEDSLRSVSEVGFEGDTDEARLDAGAQTIAMPPVHPVDDDESSDQLPDVGAATIAMPPIFRSDSDEADVGAATVSMEAASRPEDDVGAATMAMAPVTQPLFEAQEVSDVRDRPDSEVQRQLAALDADTMPEQELDEGDRTIAMPPVQVQDDTGSSTVLDPTAGATEDETPAHGIPSSKTRAYNSGELSRLFERDR